MSIMMVNMVVSWYRQKKFVDLVVYMGGEIGMDELLELGFVGEGDKWFVYDQDDGDCKQGGCEENCVEVEGCVEEVGEMLSECYYVEVFVLEVEFEFDGGVDSFDSLFCVLFQVIIEVFRNSIILQRFVDVCCFLIFVQEFS